MRTTTWWSVGLLAVVLLIGQAASAEQMVLYLPFDGDALDQSGKGNDATLVNGPGYGTGIAGQALALNGVNEYATVADSLSLRIGPYTVSAWVNPTIDNEYWTGIIGKPGRNWNMWMGNSNNQHGTGGGFIHHRYRDGSNTNAGAGDTPSGSAPFGTWTHVVITNDGERSFTYLNGQRVAYGTLSNLVVSNATANIGRSLDGGNSGYYNGLIDDVAVWDGNLTPGQIKHVAAGGSSTNLPQPISPLLLGYWPMDETSGNVVHDASGRGHDGPVTGSNVWAAGKIGGALQFTGGSGDRVMLDHPVDIESEYTIAAWFRDLMPSGAWRTLTRGMSNDHQIIIENTSWDLGMYANAQGGFRQASPTTVMSGLDDDLWHHIAAVGHDGRTDFYIDGIYAATSDRQSFTDVWAIGNHTGGGQKFAQYLDDLAIFGTALSAEQIRALAAGEVTPTTVIPEPATLSLLALSGLALLRRRKR